MVKALQRGDRKNEPIFDVGLSSRLRGACDEMRSLEATISIFQGPGKTESGFCVWMLALRADDRSEGLCDRPGQGIDWEGNVLRYLRDWVLNIGGNPYQPYDDNS